MNRRCVRWGRADGRGGVLPRLSRTDLQAHLQNGETIADVAAAQGKSVSGLEDAMVAALKANLDANTTLTAQEKVADVALMRSHLHAMVSANDSSVHGSGPMGAGWAGSRLGVSSWRWSEE